MTQINNYSLGLHERLGKEKYLYNIFSEVEDSYHESIIKSTWIKIKLLAFLKTSNQKLIFVSI